MTDLHHSLSRYHRQTLLPGIGEDGQRRLGESHALIVGCGALGTVIADALARAGVGHLTLVDRDVVELTNLQRQVLFDESDAQAATPKAVAAQSRLAAINSAIDITAHVDDFNPRNCERLAEGADIYLDGLDNFETRYLLNDLAVSHGVPYIYGGAVGTTGMSFTILPEEPSNRPNVQTSKSERGTSQQVNKSTIQPDAALDDNHSELGTPATAGKLHSELRSPCLRCLFPDPPPAGTMATCDTAGVLGPVVGIIALHQAAQAIKILSGNVHAVDRSMLSIDQWTNEWRRFDVSGARNPECQCCGRREFAFLMRRAGATSGGGGAVSLCGRNAVQINPSVGSQAASMNLAQVAARLMPHGRFSHTEHLLRGEFSAEKGTDGVAIQLMLFPTGRAIITGTEQPDVARSIYAKYIGV